MDTKQQQQRSTVSVADAIRAALYDIDDRHLAPNAAKFTLTSALARAEALEALAQINLEWHERGIPGMESAGWKPWLALLDRVRS